MKKKEKEEKTMKKCEHKRCREEYEITTPTGKFCWKHWEESLTKGDHDGMQ